MPCELRADMLGRFRSIAKTVVSSKLGTSKVGLEMERSLYEKVLRIGL